MRFGRPLQRVLALAAKETTHVRRDPRTLYMALGVPAMMILLFGFGVSFDRDALPLAIVDQDHGEASRRLERAFVGGGEFVVAARPGDPKDVDGLFRKGAASAALVIPVGFARDSARPGGANVQLLLDGADANGANLALGKADALAQAAGVGLEHREVRGSPPVEARIWTRFNPSNRSALFLVPGLVALILSMVTVMLTALTVAREWERGSMEQLFATPVGRSEIILGKLLPYLALGVVQLLLVLVAGSYVFDVPMRGSIGLLAMMSVLFLLGMLGQGLLLSIVTRNQMVATQIGTMSTMLPSMLLSGFMYPVENMPIVLRAVSAVIPARYFIDGLRGVLLKGNGLAQLWPQVVALTIFAAAMLVASTAAFKRRLA